MNAVATVTEEENGVRLRLFELADGKETAQILLQGIDGVTGFTSDPEQDTVWFLAKEASTGKTLLCGWDFENSSVKTFNLGYSDYENYIYKENN